MKGRKLFLIAGITVLASTLWGKCSHQGIRPGVYQIISNAGQGGLEYCVDRDSHDRGIANDADQNVYDLRFVRCNETVFQRFSIGHPDSLGCYQIWSVADGTGEDRRVWAQMTGPATSDFHYTPIINVKCADAEGHCSLPVFYWWIEHLASDVYVIHNAGSATCIDRRNDEDPAVPQALDCRGVPSQSFILRPMGGHRNRK